MNFIERWYTKEEVNKNIKSEIHYFLFGIAIMTVLGLLWLFQ
ncbi:MAG: hypothetical protein ACRCY4_02465 [Brevinema sp.]